MDESLIKRIMPHSIEAEQAVIGSMIMDEEAVVSIPVLLRRPILDCGTTG